MHLTSKDGYLIPSLDDSFDLIAARALRDAMAEYGQCPGLLKSLLENIAIVQSSAGPAKPTTPTNETI